MLRVNIKEIEGCYLTAIVIHKIYSLFFKIR